MKDFWTLADNSLILCKNDKATFCFTFTEVLKLLRKKNPRIPKKIAKECLPRFNEYCKRKLPFILAKRATMPPISSEASRKQVEEYLRDMHYHRIVNDLPEYTQDAIKAYTTDPEYKHNLIYYRRIEEGIKQMPTLTREIVLFRGQDTEDFVPTLWFSTTTDYQIAIDHFTEKGCCLFVLYIQEGVQVLPVYEFERNFFAWEGEVIVQGGGYLEFIREDKVGNIPTFMYRYSMTPFRKAEPIIPVPLSPPKKDLVKIAKMIDASQIDEELALFEEEPSKENRLQAIKVQLTDLDEADYEEIYNLVFQGAES